MPKFILGFICGIVIMLLNPNLRWPPREEPKPEPVVTPAASTPRPTPTRDWMYDHTRGPLNQPPHSSL